MSELRETHTLHLTDTVLADKDWRSERCLFDLNDERCYHDTEGTFLVSSITTGGSTGSSFRQTIHEWGCKQRNKHAYICVVHLLQRVINDNLLDSAIQLESIDFSFDLMSIVGDVLYALVVKQEQQLFMARKRSAMIKKQTGWTKFAHKSLRATDFTSMYVAQKGSVHPNFSKPIQIGFLTMNSTTSPRSQTISGLDNLQVDFHCTVDEKHYFQDVQQWKQKFLAEQKARQNTDLLFAKLQARVLELEQEIVQYREQVMQMEELRDVDIVPIVYDGNMRVQEEKLKRGIFAAKRLLSNEKSISPSNQQVWIPQLIRHLLSFVSNDHVSLCKASLLNKSWYKVASSDYYWKPLCLQRYTLHVFNDFKPYQTQFAAYWKKELADEKEYVKLEFGEQDSPEPNKNVKKANPFAAKVASVLANLQPLHALEEPQNDNEEKGDDDEWEMLSKTVINM